MPTLTDYRVLQDSSFELDPNNDTHVINFNMPADFVSGTNLAKPILAFIVRPVVESSVQITQGLDAGNILTTTFQPSSRRGLWEPFSGSMLFPGAANELWFELLNGVGRVRFSKVVLWYQRDV